MAARSETGCSVVRPVFRNVSHCRLLDLETRYLGPISLSGVRRVRLSAHHHDHHHHDRHHHDHHHDHHHYDHHHHDHHHHDLNHDHHHHDNQQDQGYCLLLLRRRNVKSWSISSLCLSKSSMLLLLGKCTRHLRQGQELPQYRQKLAFEANPKWVKQKWTQLF